MVVGGTGVVAEGAQVHEDVFALGGLDAPPASARVAITSRSEPRRSARG